MLWPFANEPSNENLVDFWIADPDFTNCKIWSEIWFRTEGVSPLRARRSPPLGHQFFAEVCND